MASATRFTTTELGALEAKIASDHYGPVERSLGDISPPGQIPDRPSEPGQIQERARRVFLRFREVQHVVQQLADGVIDAVHRRRAIAQTRIRIVKNVAYGHGLILINPLPINVWGRRPIILLDDFAAVPIDGPLWRRGKASTAATFV